MNAEELIAAGIPLGATNAITLLNAEAALDWISEHTTLVFDKEDVSTIEALPASAKLFVVKFTETLKRREGVQSQSIEGMSQSFSTQDKSTLIYQLAQSLLGSYLKSQVRVFPAKRRW